MTKSELINKVSEVTNLPKNTNEFIINNLFDVIMNTVASGEKIQIVGFGSFEKHHREAREGRNPKDGTPIKIEATDVPAFKAGKAFKDAVK
jgi:DNA-binding protein HU-beta